MFEFFNDIFIMLEDFFGTAAFTFIGLVFLIIITALTLYVMHVYEK